MDGLRASTEMKMLQTLILHVYSHLITTSTSVDNMIATINQCSVQLVTTDGVYKTERVHMSVWSLITHSRYTAHRAKH